MEEMHGRAPKLKELSNPFTCCVTGMVTGIATFGSVYRPEAQTGRKPVAVGPWYDVAPFAVVCFT
jgi:hypothetical protein